MFNIVNLIILLQWIHKQRYQPRRYEWHQFSLIHFCFGDVTEFDLDVHRIGTLEFNVEQRLDFSAKFAFDWQSVGLVVGEEKTILDGHLSEIKKWIG